MTMQNTVATRMRRNRPTPGNAIVDEEASTPQSPCHRPGGIAVATMNPGMPRPVWKGAITFGLVTIPIGLYSAIERKSELSFRLLHAKDQSPVDYRRVCQQEDVEVPWADIVRGYEYEKGHFVVVTD